MTEENEYQSKLKKQIEQFRQVENIHDLPGIFHYWTSSYLAAPLTELFATADPIQIFTNAFAESAQEKRPIFLSLGAGDCSIEIDIAQRLKRTGMDFVIECAELSDVLLTRGRKAAATAGVAEFMEFNEVDINRWQTQRTYAAVMANHSLHHIVALEHVFDQVASALSPGGRFVISDMIGRNGHMRWPEAEALVRGIWATLPDSKKYNHQLQRLETTFVNWDCSHEGFEGVRAQDILPSLLPRFDFLAFMGFGNLTDVFVDRSFGHNYDPDSSLDREFIDRVHAVNELLIDLGYLKPTIVIATMTHKGQASGPPKCYRNRLPEFCVRQPIASAAVDVALAEACDITAIRNEAQRVQDALDQSIESYRQAEAKLLELQCSTSWRITAPLRWIKVRLSEFYNSRY